MPGTGCTVTEVDRTKEPKLDIRKLQRAIVDGLADVKAHNIVVFNTEALSPLFERVIIASGTSHRQTRALASSVRETVKKRGLPVLRTEGEDNGEWIIVDCGAAVAHIMQPAIRAYYHLEEIWGVKPVKMKGAGDGRVPMHVRPAGFRAAPSTGAAASYVVRSGANAASRPAPKKAAKKPAKKSPARTPTRAPVKVPTRAPVKAPVRAVAKAAAKRAPKSPARKPAATRGAKPASKRTAKPPPKALTRSR